MVRRGGGSGFISLVSCSAASLQLPCLPSQSCFLFTHSFCFSVGRAALTKSAQSLRSWPESSFSLKPSQRRSFSFSCVSSGSQDGEDGSHRLRRSCASLCGSWWPVGVGCLVTVKPCAGGACLPPTRTGLWRSPQWQSRAKKTSPKWRSSKCVSLATAPTWARTSNWSAARRDGRSRYTVQPHFRYFHHHLLPLI